MDRVRVINKAERNTPNRRVRITPEIMALVERMPHWVQTSAFAGEALGRGDNVYLDVARLDPRKPGYPASTLSNSRLIKAHINKYFGELKWLVS